MTARRVRTVVMALSLAMIAFGARATPRVGAQAPDFAGTNSYNEIVRLSDFAGQKVVLEWTNHSCPFVRKYYGTRNMQTLQDDLTRDSVVWLTIVSSAPGQPGYVTAEEANGLTQARGAKPTHVILDPTGEIGHLYEVRTTPYMVLILEDGAVGYRGAVDSIRSARKADVARATNYVRAAYGEIMAGRKVSRPDTSPYGCSIKYAD